MREALALLRRTPEVDAHRLFVVGQSQGGALAPRIAAADGHVAGVVILAGPTRAFGELVVDQMTYLSTLEPGNAALAAQIEAARRFEKTIADPALLPDQEIASPWAGQMKGAYFLEQRAYDPGGTARALACPILLLQGKRDFQVDERDLAGWRRALAGRADVTFAEVERPHRIVEVGRTGKNNRVRTLGLYELDPAPAGATRVRFTLETVPATLADRLMEGLGARSWFRRKNLRAMRRLRGILEGGEVAEGRGARVTVAGG